MLSIRTNKRRGAPKVRTGCVTCKRRRVKCDETRPTCTRCGKYGIVCGGYAPPNAWVFKSGLIPETNEYSLVKTICLSPESAVDGRALVFFLDKVAPNLASFMPKAEPFWTRVVPQLSYADDAVRSMLIATSSLKESTYVAIDYSHLELCRTIFRKHYFKGVEALTRLDRQPSTHVLLVCCLLLLACENFQGSTKTGLTHINSGWQIIQEWKDCYDRSRTQPSEADGLITDYIEPFFLRLRDQSSAYGLPYGSGWYLEDLNNRYHGLDEIVEFKDLFAARDGLALILNHCFVEQSAKWYKQASFEGKDVKIDTWLLLWRRAFSPLMKSLQVTTSLEARTAELLNVHVQALSIYLDASSSTTEVRWDIHLEKFRALLGRCTDLIKREPLAISNEWVEYDQRLCLFEYDFGFIAPLFMIASRCRDPSLRRQATRLMRYLHRQEGQWDSCSAAKVADAIINIEEEEITSLTRLKDVPESRRIRALDAELHCPGQVILTFSRSPYIHREKRAIEWGTWSSPELDTVTHWPLQHILQCSGYQGLIRSAAGACICQSYRV